eukprot:8506023-Pyramimonas_sp.AAC.2
MPPGTFKKAARPEEGEETPGEEEAPNDASPPTEEEMLEVSEGAQEVGEVECKHKGCTQSAIIMVGSTPYCMMHGVEKRCKSEGCIKPSRCGTPYCIAHGGGKRCQHEGCTKGAVGKIPFCKGHGGGKRCQHEGCTKSAEGKTQFCISHGGGRRCQHEGCTKSSRSGTNYCIAHGGKRCGHGD